MRKKLFLNANKLLLFLFSLCLFAQENKFEILGRSEPKKQVFTSENIKEIISNHKLVAILPFKVSFTNKTNLNNTSLEEIKKTEDILSKNLQSSLNNYLLSKKSNYSVSFLEVDKINLLLKNNKMFDNIEDYSKEEIAKVLKVDGVISGEFYKEKLQSNLSAIASILITKDSSFSKTGNGKIILSIHDSSKGELLWQFSKLMEEDFLSSNDRLIDRMMRKVSRNFPYKK
ncbi:MAG: hypothetical protein ACEQSF_04705 [Solirubrobacteraceae bacterium]